MLLYGNTTIAGKAEFVQSRCACMHARYLLCNGLETSLFLSEKYPCSLQENLGTLFCYTDLSFASLLRLMATQWVMTKDQQLKPATDDKCTLAKRQRVSGPAISHALFSHALPADSHSIALPYSSYSSRLLFSPLQNGRERRRSREDGSRGHNEAEQRKSRPLFQM